MSRPPSAVERLAGPKQLSQARGVRPRIPKHKAQAKGLQVLERGCGRARRLPSGSHIQLCPPTVLLKPCRRPQPRAQVHPLGSSSLEVLKLPLSLSGPASWKLSFQTLLTARPQSPLAGLCPSHLHIAGLS